jgi:hypothetical protein
MRMIKSRRMSWRGVACRRQEAEEKYCRSSAGKQKERYHLKDLSVDGRARTGLIWLRIGKSGGLF